MRKTSFAGKFFEGGSPSLAKNNYTPGSSNIAVAGKWSRIESMYFRLKMGMSFQPAMLVYQRVVHCLGW